jgi:phospho-N-acetylmuramoyl-pentapeptide-transferase
MTLSNSLPASWPLHTALLASAIAFAATAVTTRPLIGWLRGHHCGKAIREDGPDHAAKSGTPTMGGLAALFVIGVGSLVVAWSSGAWATMGVIVVGMTGYALLGLADDLAGLARRSARRELGVGLTARRMLAAQLLIAVVVSALLWTTTTPAISMLPAVAIGALIIVGTVNGVNMSDGLDGLAAGLCAIAFVAMGLVTQEFRSTVSKVEPDHNLAIIVLCWVVAGACLGFLLYNRHPARVFMGNVTSMALGGGLALAALASGVGAALLPVIGAVFVAEVLSVIVQVGFFKATGGRRVFRMAPLHHHLELGGRTETKVVREFWAAGLLVGLLGVMIAARIASGI